MHPLQDFYLHFIDPKLNQSHADRVGVSLNDVYAVSRERLLRYSKETYAGLLAQVVACGDAAAEVDHYLERAVRPMYATDRDPQATPPKCPVSNLMQGKKRMPQYRL